MEKGLRPRRGDEISLTINSLSGDGRAVARRDGIVCFVENTVPGDTVKAIVKKVKKNFTEAKAVEILTPSIHRTQPQCKHFGICGGCRWQNLSYDAQLNFKRQMVLDAFSRIGKFDRVDVLPIIGCENPYYYRNKMEFTFSNHRWLTDDEMQQGIEMKKEIALGLHVPNRYDKVMNVEECWLQSELSSAIINFIREVCRVWDLEVYSTRTHEGYLRHLVIREGKRTGEVMVNLVTTYDIPEVMNNLTKLLIKQFPEITTIVNNITERKSMVAVGESEKIYHGKGFITEKLNDYTFHISANSFFQTSTLQAEVLYSHAKKMAELKPTDIVYDLYCGTGTIAIVLSDAVERVVGIEVIESAINDALRNAQLNRINNCFFLVGDLKEKLTRDSGWLKEHPQPTVVVLDPPRSGVHEKVIQQIVKLHPDRIVYVSCNPSTQSRDARLLVDSGYELRVVQPVDMFPHTDHVETVALFRKC